MGNSPSKLWPTVAPQWMLDLPESLESFCYRMYKCFIYDDRYMMYVSGLVNTLILTGLALLMGLGGGGDFLITLLLLFKAHGKDIVVLDHPFECGCYYFKKER